MNYLFFELLLDLSYFLPFLLFLMATFYVVVKLDLTILVADFGVVQVIENVFCAMFVFWRGFLHVFKMFLMPNTTLF